MDGEFSAELLLHPDRAPAAALPERHLRRHERRHRHGSCRIYGHGPDNQAFQRLCGGQLPAQDRAAGMQFLFLPALFRLYSRRHADHVHDIQDAARRPVRGHDRGRQHRGDRCAAVFAQERGHRLLRTEQQPGYRSRPRACDIHAPSIRRGFPCALLALHRHFLRRPDGGRFDKAAQEGFQAGEAGAFARPFLPAQGLEGGAEHALLFVQLRHSLHLCGNLRPRGAGHHQRYGSILLPLRNRTHRIAPDRSQGPEGQQNQL